MRFHADALMLTSAKLCFLIRLRGWMGHFT